METLLDLYKEDQITCNNFLDSLNLQVSIKLHGISLQLYFNEETNKYEYRTHSADIHIGPKISKLTKLFCQDITDAIGLLKEKKDIVSQYKFINLIIYNKELYLISFMHLANPSIIDDYDSLLTLSIQLGIKTIPVVFRGRLPKDKQDSIKAFLSMPQTIGSNQFKETFKTIFSHQDLESDYNNGLIMSQQPFNIEGSINSLVFSVNFGNKIASYKIEDSAYQQLKKEENARKDLCISQHKSDYLIVTRCFVDWLENIAETMDDSHIKSLENNFVKMCDNKKVLMKLLNVAAKLPIRNDSKFMLQINMLSDDIQQLIRKHGTPMRTLVEQFLLTFYKHKESYPGVDSSDKELIKKINNIIDKM